MNEPLVGITIRHAGRVLFPHDTLSGEIQIDVPVRDVPVRDVPIQPDGDPRELQSVELSVLWRTEGKGDEDLGIHFFKRYVADERNRAALHEMKTFSTVLPNSPLSYDGPSVKIRWCVRVRAFLSRGREVVAEQPFQLGNVPTPGRALAAVGSA